MSPLHTDVAHDADLLLGLWFITALSRKLVPSYIIQSQQLQLDHIPKCLLNLVDGSCSKFWPHIIA